MLRLPLLLLLRQPGWARLLHCSWRLRYALSWHMGQPHMLLLLLYLGWLGPHWLGWLPLLLLLWWRPASHVRHPACSHLLLLLLRLLLPLLLHCRRRRCTWPRLLLLLLYSREPLAHTCYCCSPQHLLLLRLRQQCEQQSLQA